MLNVEFERMTVPAGSDVTMELTISTRVNVTSVAAKRQVNRLLLERVGNLLYAEEPNLLVGTRLLWRVPVWLGIANPRPRGFRGDARCGCPEWRNPVYPAAVSRNGSVWRCPCSTCHTQTEPSWSACLRRNGCRIQFTAGHSRRRGSLVGHDRHWHPASNIRRLSNTDSGLILVPVPGKMYLRRLSEVCPAFYLCARAILDIGDLILLMQSF